MPTDRGATDRDEGRSGPSLVAWVLVPALLVGVPVLLAGCLAVRYAQNNFFRETFVIQIESVDENVVCIEPFDLARRERQCLSTVPSEDRWELTGRDPNWYAENVGRCVEVESVTHAAFWARVVELTDCPRAADDPPGYVATTEPEGSVYQIAGVGTSCSSRCPPGAKRYTVRLLRFGHPLAEAKQLSLAADAGPLDELGDYPECVRAIVNGAEVERWEPSPCS